MVNNNYVLFGANSELAKSFAGKLLKKNYNVYGISRSNLDFLPNKKQLRIDHYEKNFNEIKNFISNIDNPYVVIFNGYLAENRNLYFPTNQEITQTIKINYLIPLKITNNLAKINDVKKFVYISSMAAIKPRRKNYIYGLAKKSLEISNVLN